MTLNEIKEKMHILEQYLMTLNKKTPHYRDTKKHYERLKTKMFKMIKQKKKV